MASAGVVVVVPSLSFLVLVFPCHVTVTLVWTTTSLLSLSLDDDDIDDIDDTDDDAFMSSQQGT